MASQFSLGSFVALRLSAVGRRRSLLLALCSKLDILEPHSFHFREILFHECSPRQCFSMPREKVFHLKPGQSLDAFFKGLPVSARKVCPPKALTKNHIAGDERFLLRPVDADRPRRMPWSVNDLERHVAHLEFPFLEENLRFKLLDAHGGSVMRRQPPDKIQLSLMKGDERSGIGESANRFHVIRMAVSQETEINVMRRDGEFGKVVFHVLEEVLMPGIDEDGF